MDFLEDRLCVSSELNKNRQAALEWKTAMQEVMGSHDSNGISHITDDNKMHKNNAAVIFSFCQFVIVRVDVALAVAL